MNSKASMKLADMMMEQYDDSTGHYDRYELQVLRVAAEVGLNTFDAACSRIFGWNDWDTL